MTFVAILIFVLAAAVGAFAGSFCANVYPDRRRASAHPSPSLQLGMGDAHPYRALQEAAPVDAVKLALDLADEAVRRERARVLAIVRAAGTADGTKDGKRVMAAIIDGVANSTQAG